MAEHSGDLRQPDIRQAPRPRIDTGHVLQAIEPIWHTKPETAGRVRGRIETVLDWAKVRDYRAGEIGAVGGSPCDAAPRQSKVRKVRHPAPFKDVGAFMVALKHKAGISARALEFTIQAARTTKTLDATSPEIDLDGKMWTIPENRMKGEREHRIPLSDAAVAMLRAMKEIAHSDYIFPGAKPGQPLSEMSMLMLLRRWVTARASSPPTASAPPSATGLPKRPASQRGRGNGHIPRGRGQGRGRISPR